MARRRMRLILCVVSIAELTVGFLTTTTTKTPSVYRHYTLKAAKSHEEVEEIRNIRDEAAAGGLEWWVNKQVKKNRLRFDSERKAHTIKKRKGRRRLHWSGENVVWYGDAKTSRIRFSALDIEAFDIHRRAISKTAGSFVATARMTAQDLEASAWLRFLLTKLLKVVLNQIDDPPLQRQLAAFSTRLTPQGRIRLDATADDGLRFTVSFRLDVENGNIALRSPELELAPGLYTPPLSSGLPLPAPVIESLAALYLSAVAVDASRSSCRLSKLNFKQNAIEITLISSAVSAEKQEQDRLFFLRRRYITSNARTKKKQFISSLTTQPIKTKQKKLSTTLENKKVLQRTSAAALAAVIAKVVPAPVKGRPIITEWRVDKTTLRAMLTGDAMHPLRHSYLVGDEWPWLLNPRNRPRKRVTLAFCILTAALNLLAAADACNSALRVVAHRLWLSALKPPLHLIAKVGKRCWRIATLPLRLVTRAASEVISNTLSLRRKSRASLAAVPAIAPRPHKFHLHRNKKKLLRSSPSLSTQPGHCQSSSSSSFSARIQQGGIVPPSSQA